MKRNRKPKTAPPNGKCWYRIQNRADGESEIRIDLMEEIGGWGISAKKFREDLNRLGKTENIHLHIHSDGGSIPEGLEVYNALIEHEGQVRVSVGALAASMASVIAMAGDPISIAKNGMLMMHNPWTMAMGDAEELKKVAGTLEKFKTAIVDAYRAQTGHDVDVIAALMDDETWMSASEAKDMGFVDSIDGDMTEEEKEEEARNFNLTRFRNSARFSSKPAAQNTPGTARTDPLGTVEPPVAAASQPNNPRNQHMDPAKDPPPPDPKAVEEEAKKRAEELYKGKLKRDQEIDAIVLAVRKRDKKDFGDLAAKFKQEDKTPAEFSNAIVFSDEFKPFEVHGGVDVVSEPLDGIKGTPGFFLVNSPEYRAIAERVIKGGRGSIPQRTEILLNMPFNISQYRDTPLGRQFMNAASEPSSATLTSIQKLPMVIELGVRPLMVKDLIAPGATGQTTIRYIRENAIPNAAAPTAEGTPKTELLFDYSEVDSPVRKVAAYVKVTDELFADYLAVASYINQRLPYMVERETENQLLNGSGTAPALTGILNTAGILTQALGTDTAPDAIYKAIAKLRWTSFFEPDGIVINPVNWQTIRLLKDSMGQYYGGGPFTAAYGNGPLVSIESLWGKPCAITPLIPAGTALVGAYRLGAQYFQRQGLTIDMTNSDQDDFIKNRMTLRAEERLALAVYRPSAFCTVTGLL